MKKAINSNKAPEPIGPYNQAILAKDTLYLSGQIAINAEDGQPVNGDIRMETKQVMDNLGAVLREAGMDYSNIVKCSIFLVDLGDFALVNDVYGSYFLTNAPARETVQVAALPKGMRLEISAVAVVD